MTIPKNVQGFVPPPPVTVKRANLLLVVLSRTTPSKAAPVFLFAHG